MQAHSLARHFAAVLLLVPAAFASTYTVDPAGGGNFTDIQTAILASQPGDVLLVQPGNYAPFALDRGLSIVGYGACRSGSITIAGIPAGETAVIVRLEADDLGIQGCAGHVIVQDMQQVANISVTASPDVRFARIAMPTLDSSAPVDGFTAQGSRVEFVSSWVSGPGGSSCATPALSGAVGADCGSSRLHMTHTSLRGGAGSSCAQQNYACASGGTGLDMHAGADVILCGGLSDVFQGGGAGINLFYGYCSFDGITGIPALVRSGATLRRSGVDVRDWSYDTGPNCYHWVFPGVQLQGGTENSPALADPCLSVSGNAAPGSSVQFLLDAPPGSSAILYFGRNAIVVTDPNIVIEQLAARARTVNLGTIQASGQGHFTWPISAALTPGVKLFAQAEVTLASGEVRRTNSVPVVLH